MAPWPLGQDGPKRKALERRAFQKRIRGLDLTMIQAIGTDLVEIERVRKLLKRHGEKALRRLFTPEELDYALRHQDPVPSLAARIAAKEAFQKCWPESLSWKEVWVGMEGRRPVLRFGPRLKARLEVEGLRAHLSLSHEKGHALAVVILEARGPRAG